MDAAGEVAQLLDRLPELGDRARVAGGGWSRWAAGTAGIAVVLLATAVSLATADDNLINALLVADGIVLLPGWLLWTWLSPIAR